MPVAIRQNLLLSIKVPRDRFCNPKLQQLQVSTLETLLFDSTADNSENFSIFFANEGHGSLTGSKSSGSCTIWRTCSAWGCWTNWVWSRHSASCKNHTLRTKKHAQFELGVNLWKSWLFGYLQSCSSNIRKLQLNACVFYKKTVINR